MFVDPWGMLKIANGSSQEDRNILLEDLQKLSNDKIQYKKDKYGNETNKFEYIAADNSNLTRPVGTMLLRELIDDETDFVITITSNEANKKKR